MREYSARELTHIDFDGFSIGGLALGEPKTDEYAMIRIVKSIVPEKKLVYLMGVGSPAELLEAIALGVDCFDSRFPTQNARRGTLFTRSGFLRITNTRYKDDALPLDEQCSCITCASYSRAYIRHLLVHKEGVGLRLASYHNIYFLQWLMRRAQESIKEGTFYQFKEEIQKKFVRV